MNLKQIEKKLLKKLGEGKSYYCRCFLLRDGRKTAFVHEHNAICKLVKISLEKYLKLGGCRLHVVQNNGIAIETGQKLTEEQVKTIEIFMKENNFSYLIYSQLNPARDFSLTAFMGLKPYMFVGALKSRKKSFEITNF